MNKFTDLTGDPVYDYLKTQIAIGYTLTGGHIEEHKVAAHDQPRKEIHVQIKAENGPTGTIVYNYKKLLRSF